MASILPTCPLTPDDLLRHPCIGIRMPSGKPYRWEFERHGQSLVIDPKGQLTLDNPKNMAEAAISGLGIAYVPERVVSRSLADGRLVEVLEDGCPPIPGLFLYYPGHRHIPSGLQAFIEVLKECTSANGENNDAKGF